MYIIETKQLEKTYQKARALRGVDLQLEAGRIYGLVGNNGAGKTTLFRILAGLARPTKGSFSLLGETTERGQNKARKKVGFLIEEPVFYPNMSAGANLRNIQLMLGGGKKAELTHLLELVGLEPASRQRLRTFSMGMKQRYGLAAAMVGDPTLLVLDEPLNGLDPRGTREINALLQDLVKQGKTVLLSSHLLAQLYNIATDYIFMDHGKVIRELSHRELQNLCDFRMTVRTAEPAKAEAVLRQNLPEIEEIQTGEGCLILPYCTQNSGSVLRVLRESQLEATVETSGQSLEDYFLSLVDQA